jgi:hypothetical protein
VGVVTSGGNQDNGTFWLAVGAVPLSIGLAHRRRATALLVVVATVVAVLVIGFAIVIPKAKAS